MSFAFIIPPFSWMLADCSSVSCLPCPLKLWIKSCWMDFALCTRLMHTIYKCVQINKTLPEWEGRESIDYVSWKPEHTMWGDPFKTLPDWQTLGSLYPLSVGWIWMQQQPASAHFLCPWLYILHSMTVRLTVVQPMARLICFKKGYGVFYQFRAFLFTDGWGFSCCWMKS